MVCLGVNRTSMVDGFDSCVDRMKTEEFVESGLAELDFARMLFINDHDFRFAVLKGKRGEDYDFEITVDEWLVCADVKCKLEDTDISENTIRNVLSDA
jgi:hypothetical protein